MNFAAGGSQLGAKTPSGEDHAGKGVNCMRHIGLDLHKQSLEVCALDAQGKRLFRLAVDCSRPALEQFARKQLCKDDRLALEATTNTWAVVEILRPFVAEIVVGNPLQIKAIAQAKVKTDKIDAAVFAHLLRCDYLPKVWQPDAATQRLRHSGVVRPCSRVGEVATHGPALRFHDWTLEPCTRVTARPAEEARHPGRRRYAFVPLFPVRASFQQGRAGADGLPGGDQVPVHGWRGGRSAPGGRVL